MSPIQIFLCLCCVLAISTGQVMFKKAGLLLNEHESWLHSQVVLTIGIAGLIYSSATVLWIYLLKDIPLSKAYMLMAVSFVAVPIASVYIFQESLNFHFFVGSTLIIAGLFIVLMN